MNRTLEFFEELAERLDLTEREKQIVIGRLWSRTFEQMAIDLGER